MKKSLWFILVLLVSCKTAPFGTIKVQDDERLVMQLAILKADYETDDPEALLLNHDSVYEFPSSKLIEDDYVKFDIVEEDGSQTSMQVTYLWEADVYIDLGVEMQRKMKVDEMTYDDGADGVTTPVYEKQIFTTDGVYQTDEWHILGRNYNKRWGETKGSGVYFLLRINSRSSEG